MQDAHIEIELRDGVHDRAGEERILLAFELAAAIDGATKVELVVDEVINRSVELKLLEADILRTPAEARLEITHVLRLAEVLFLDLSMERHDDACIDAELLQVFRKSAHDISQAAHLHERSALSCSDQHATDTRVFGLLFLLLN